MFRIQALFTLALFSISISIVSAGIIDPAVLTFDMNACLSEAGNGTHSDYSELIAQPSNNGAVRLSAASGYVYRENPTVNPHSCTPGLNGTNAICIAVNPFCDYLPGSAEALRFDVLVEPLVGETIRIEELNFQQKAPEMFDWVNGTTARNNYPTLYGIRILANNQLIYEEHDIPTTREWNLETTNFDGNSNFLVANPTVFSFELLPYCSAGVIGFYSIWDIEDISISAGCVNDCSEVVNGGEVFLLDGTHTYYACEGNAEFQIQNNSTLKPEDFDYLITDEDFNIIRVSESSADLNLNDFMAGSYFVWGYSGDGTSLLGSNISQITNASCIELTSNSITVLINKPAGGVISGGPFEFCNSRQNSSFIPADAISLTGNIGTNSRWIVTDETSNEILFVPADPSEVDFSNFEPGTCYIYHVSFDGWLKGLEAGGLISELESGSEISSTCYDLSNPIAVIKKELVSPALSGGPFTFCVGDGTADRIALSDIQHTTGSGQINNWVATDETGTTILALAGSITDFDFDNSGIGTCLVWSLSYDNITGLEVDENFANLTGCYTASSALQVNRYESAGGTLTGGPFEFCIGDGQADIISANDIALADNSGANNQWIVTDQNGIITNLPTASYQAVDFDLDTEGTCFLSHVSYNGSVTGLELGMALAGLEGCYSLSNQLTISKLDCTPLEGGTLTGGPLEFCTSDGAADNLTNISLSQTTGDIDQWVFTTEMGIIIDLPSSLDQIDFEGTESGVCLLWNVSYESGLSGLMLGNMIATDLDGDFGLSNSLMITKSNITAGQISGGPYTFCIGDDEADNIPQGDITLMGNSGSQGVWLATDAMGSNILAIADEPSDFDFDGSGEGNCLLYHLSYENITGLAAGESIADLDGCYGLSNEIVVTRNYVNGGILEGGPGYFEFCIGDGIPDYIPTGSLSLSGNVGDTNTWVITNTSATEILAIPNSPHDVDFENSVPGTCVLWSLSSTGPVSGLEVGENFLSVQGCVSSSTFISIFRYQNTPAVLAGGPFEICAQDNVPDMIMDGSVMLSGNTGANNQWIITDENDIIKYLPLSNYDEVDFDPTEFGNYFLYLLSYDGPIDGLIGGQSINNLTGCYSLSNSLLIESQNCFDPFSELTINEISPAGLVELKNTSETTLDIADYWLCSYPLFREIKNLDIACGEDLELRAGESIFIQIDFEISGNSGELALMYEDNVSGTKKMNHYLVWGAPQSNMTEQAVAEGFWSEGDMISSIPNGMVLKYDGSGYHSSDWTIEDDSNCSPSASENLFSKLSAQLYPNPAKDKLNIEITDATAQTLQIEIISKLGKVLLSSSLTGQKTVLDLEALEAGMYFIRIKDKSNSITRTIAKI